MHNINTCVTSTTKNISEDSCTTNTHMHHQEHMSGYMHNIHIHAPHTHTYTTYTYMHYQIPPENKICLVDPISVLYERPNQNERFLLNNMFFSAFQWNALCISCSWAFHCAFHWNVLCISVKCTVKCTAHFSEMRSEMHSAFHWNAQCISLKCTVKCTVKCPTTWNALCFSLKCAVFHWKAQRISAKFDELLGSTKYRSFDIRKTKNVGVLTSFAQQRKHWYPVHMDG